MSNAADREMNYRIRRAEEGDVEAISLVEKACFVSPWSKEALYRDIVRNERAHYYVAEVDGVVVAYAGIWYIIDEGHITNVAVSPGFRLMGLASGMLDFMLEEAKLSGIRSFTLEVRAGNAEAIRLYTKFGFEGVGIRPGYYIEENEDALVMWLNTGSSSVICGGN